MTVVVRYENGRKIYQSIGILGSSKEDRAKADKLDEILRIRLLELIKSFEEEGIFLEDIKKGNVYIYWHLGRVLHEILYESGLVDPAEKSLFWLNAKIHIPDILMKEDRGPRRNHLEYCCRLGRFSIKKVKKINWAEWVYLFDSPGINKEKRFDIWFERKADQKNAVLGRTSIRVFVQCLNNMIGNIEADDLSDEEIFRCYDAAWLLKDRILAYFQDKKELELKQMNSRVKEVIKQNYTKIGELIEDELSPQDFSIIIFEAIKNK